MALVTGCEPIYDLDWSSAARARTNINSAGKQIHTRLMLIRATNCVEP